MRSNLLLLTVFLSGCASMGGSDPAVGHFVYSGPVNAVADVLTIKWRYGFKFDIDPGSVTKMTLTCSPIPGTDISVNPSQLHADAQGVAYFEGTPLAVSKDTTAWLYDKSDTKAVCVAVVSRVGKPDAVEKAPVTFSGATKPILLLQFQEAQEYNSRLKSP